MKGRDRNLPCFCGSGRKYKHCHYYKEWLDRVDPIEPIGHREEKIEVLKTVKASDIKRI